MKPAADEVRDEVARDRPQPLGPGDAACTPGAKRRDELALGLLVELGRLQQLGQLVGEVLVDELQLGDAVLVVERDGRAVLDRVAEVVDR